MTNNSEYKVPKFTVFKYQAPESDTPESEVPEYDGDSYFSVIRDLYEDRELRRVRTFFQAYKSPLIPVGRGKHMMPIYFAMIKSEYLENMTEDGQDPYWVLFDDFDIDPMCPFFLASWVLFNMHIEPSYHQLRFKKCSNKLTIIDVMDFLKITDDLHENDKLHQACSAILYCLPIPVCRLAPSKVSDSMIAKLKEFDIRHVDFYMHHPVHDPITRISRFFYDTTEQELEKQAKSDQVLNKLLAEGFLPYSSSWGLFRGNKNFTRMYEWLRRLHSDEQGSYLEALGDLLE